MPQPRTSDGRFTQTETDTLLAALTARAPKHARIIEAMSPAATPEPAASPSRIVHDPEIAALAFPSQ